MSLSEEFNESYEEAFPKPFHEKYTPIECLHHGNETETILAVKKVTDEKYIVKCYSKTHPAYEGNIWEQLKHLDCDGIVSYIEDFKDETIRYGQELCNILSYLHNQTPPFIHRDIKPDNIIVRSDGSICLIDFGTARTLKENASSDTEFAGTREYAAPEQYGFKQTDERSDIYSVGVLLNWMLYGTTKPNKQKETHLNKVIDKCMSFDPEKRVQSVALLSKKLENCKFSVRIKKRNRRIYTVFAALCFCVIAAIVYQCSRPAGITFKEPVIEKAVREILNKEAGAITKDDLSSIKELYIGKDVVYKDMDSFYSAGLGDAAAHGEIECLDDLALMENLETVCIGQESITDISELKDNQSLMSLSINLCNIDDLSPLTTIPSLETVNISENMRTKIEALGDDVRFAVNYQ